MDYSEIEMRGDLDPLADAIEKAETMFAEFGDKVSRVFKSITGVESFDDLFSKIRRGIDQFEDSEAIFNRLTAAAKYFEERAGLTVDVLRQIGEQIAKVSVYTRESVAQAEQALLEFRNVHGIGFVFQDALKAATDLAAVTGQDLVSATRTLGEVLNDPVEGMQRLKELHVTLTKQQQASIAAFMRFGDIVSAQRVILQAFNDEIGGQGAKAADTFGSRMAKLAEASEGVWRTIGGLLVPYLNKAIDVMNKVTFVVETLGKEFLDSLGPSGMQGYVDRAFSAAVSWFWKFVDAGTTAFSYAQAAVEQWDDFSQAALVDFQRAALDAFLFAADAAAAAWAKVLEVSQPVMDYLGAQWSVLKSRVLDWAATAQAAVAQAASFIADVWSKLVDAAAAAWEAIGRPVVDFGLAAVGAAYLAQAAVTGAFDIMSYVAHAYFDNTIAGLKILADGFAAQFNAIATVAQATFGFIFDAAVGAFVGPAKALNAFFSGWKTQGDSTVSYLLNLFDIFGGGISTMVQTLAAGFKGVFGFLRDLGADIVYTALEPMRDASADMQHKLIDLKAQLRGIGGPGGFELPNFEKPKLDMDAMVAAARAARDALAGMEGIGGLDFGKNLDANRAKVQAFLDKVKGILDSDAYKRFSGSETSFQRFLPQGGGGEASSSAGKMEELTALNRRVQEAAARPPELKELERQTTIMQEELMVQQAIRDHLKAAHQRRTGLTTPSFAMRDLVTPEGMGT